MSRRKEKKYHYIYKTTCNVTKRFYVGMHSTDNLDDGYFGSGKILRYSLNKHGKENHILEKLEFYKFRDELKIREKEIINEDFLKDSLCMNIALGGEGGIINKDHIEKLHKGCSNFMIEKWKDEEYKKRTLLNLYKNVSQGHKKGHYKYDNFKDKKHTEDTKRKIGEANSINQKGINNSQFGTCWITNGKENKKIKINSIISKNWKLGRIILN